MKTEDLIEETVKNIRDDRDKAARIRDMLVDAVSGDNNVDIDPEGEEGRVDVLSVAENVAMLTDVLTRMNAQIVELAKVSSKRDASTKESATSSLFDEIQKSDVVLDEN